MKDVPASVTDGGIVPESGMDQIPGMTMKGIPPVRALKIPIGMEVQDLEDAQEFLTTMEMYIPLIQPPMERHSIHPLKLAPMKAWSPYQPVTRMP